VSLPGAPVAAWPIRRAASARVHRPRRGGSRPRRRLLLLALFLLAPPRPAGGLPCLATRPRGEPSWHRRARRARGQARTLVRIADARELLARHHSAPRQGRGEAGAAQPAMPRRDAEGSLRQRLLRVLEEPSSASGGGGGAAGGGRGGGGGSGGVGKARRGAPDAGGRGGGRGGGGRGDGGSGGGQHAPRLGDWRCPNGECRFSPNFASRSHCLRCGEGRPATARQATTARQQQQQQGPRKQPATGPLGAGGSRPLLAAWGPRGADSSPTHRVPGSSLAAQALAESARLAPRPKTAAVDIGAGVHVSNSVGANGAVCGDAGVIAEPRCRLADSGAAPGATVLGGGYQRGQAEGVRRGGRWADEGVPADRFVAEDGDGGDNYEDEDAAWEDDDWGVDDQGEEGRDPSPAELKAAWLSECKAVKALEAQGIPGDSAVLAAARAARDEVERRWRAARDPHPVAKRIGWAQQRLDKAQRALAKVRFELEEYEEEVQRKRRTFDERLEAAEQRYKWRRSQLDELHDEAAGEQSTRASDGVCEMLAHEMAAMAELLEDGTAVKGKLNVLLSRLADWAGQRDAKGGRHEAFDMSRFDHISDVDGDDMCDVGSSDAGARGAASGVTAGAAGKPVWKTDASGRWKNNNRGGGAAGGAEGHGDLRGGGAAVGQSATAPGAAASDPVARGGTIAEGVPAAAAGGAKPAARAREDDSDSSRPANKSHRGEDDATAQSVEGSADDLLRAQKLQEEQRIAIQAAQEAQARFGDETSMHIAGQLYAHKISLAADRARAIGVSTMVDGKQLIELAPEAFSAWVQNVLNPAEAEAKEAKEL
jgi:hypothetical protein